MRLGDLKETSRGVDVARSANRHKEVAGRECQFDLAEMKGHLTKPNDVWTQAAWPTTAIAHTLNERIPRPRHSFSCGHAAHLQELTVHVEYPLAACSFVKGVHILSDEQVALCKACIKIRHRVVSALCVARP